MPQPLLILGTGGGAYDVLDIVEAINLKQPSWQIIGFLDDVRKIGETYLTYPILGAIHDAKQFPNAAIVNVIGSDRSFLLRPEILNKTGVSDDRYATLVHPSASVSSRVQIGAGVCVNYGVSVAGGVTIGNHVTLCPGVIVGHNTVIEDHAIVSPGAIISGSVQLGQNAYIGAGAMIRQATRIGSRALVGMGATVLSDVPTETTVVGNPAYRLR